MKRVIALVMLVITTTGLGGQEAMYDHGCGVSRESRRRELMDIPTLNNQADQMSLNFTMKPYKLRIKVDVGGLFEQHRRIIFAYGREGNPAWSTELVTITINEKADFYYEVTLRNPDVSSADEFKAEIKKILACRFGSYQMIDEGDNFMEYEVNGQRYYHGFVIGRSLAVGDKSPVGSVEFVGMSSIENYDERRKLYVQTFTNNEAMLAEHIKSHGFERIQ